MDCLAGKTQIRCKALLVGERLDVRSLSKLARTELQTIASTPLTVATEGGGVAVLFRYGAVVLFDVPAAEEAALLDRLRPYISSALSKVEVEEIQLRVDPNGTEGVENGIIVLKNHDVERFQVVAENAGKSIVLGLYEARVGESFDRIEPFALEIEITGRTRQKVAGPAAGPGLGPVEPAADGGTRATGGKAGRPLGTARPGNSESARGR